MSAWMIRAGHGGVYAEDWLDKGKIGIGWDFGSKDIASMKREQIRATYLAEHPNESKNRVAAIVGQVYRFAHEMTQGQTVVMYDPASRLYHIGAITGDCVPTRDEDDPTYTRTVRWETSASRDALKQSSKNSLGGIQTIFAVSDEVMNDLRNQPRGLRSRFRRKRQAKTPPTTMRTPAPPHMTMASNLSRTA